MKPRSGSLALLSLALCLPAFAQDAVTPLPTAAQPASVAASSTNTVGLSDIRIVRLSQVRGKVSIDRHVGRSFEEAFANIPITGGTRLLTEVGLAEVEFEDNSAIRLTPDSEVLFTELKRTATGSTISAVKVLRGMVYASLANTKENTFTVAAGNTTLQLNPSSHIRLAVDGPNSNVSVLDGTVELVDGSSTTVLKRNKSFDFDVAGGKPPEQVKLAESSFDEWDKNGIEYQKQYSSLRTSGGMGLAGTSDLNYYGSFVNMPGCGSMWQPYFVSAAWSPYDNGMWAYYPNAGYSWVSPYPWGWLPFHSGTWMSCGASGWGWQPGGSWAGLQNVAAVTGAPGGGARPMPVAPAPPRSGAPLMVPVNARPLAVSSVSSPGTFTFRKDSAGLGVPRDTFGALKYISSDVSHHGEIHTDIERSFIGPSPAMSRANMSNPNGGGRAANNGQASLGSRSVATFNRPGTDMRGNSIGDGMENGLDRHGSPANSSASARDSWQRPAPGNLSSPSMAARSVPASSTAPSGGNPSTAASHK